MAQVPSSGSESPPPRLRGDATAFSDPCPATSLPACAKGTQGMEWIACKAGFLPEVRFIFCQAIQLGQQCNAAGYSEHMPCCGDKCAHVKP